MFGYVKAYKPDLKIAEYETYKAVYCTLCKVLGQRYGIAARMTLSYDFTFLAMLRLSVKDECCGYSTMRCRCNPLKKCSCLKTDSEELDFTAAVSVILFYYKILDNFCDSGIGGKLKSIFAYPFFSRYRKKAMKLYPQVEKAAKSFYDNQLKTEKNNCKSADEAAEPTGEFLARVFARKDDDDLTARVLGQMGMCAGKWVYLCDALDDLDDDIKTKSYNVFAHKFGLYEGADAEKIKNAKNYAVGTINSYNAGVCSAFELLGEKRYGSIIRNIIYLGMKDTVKNIVNPKSKDKSNLSERN